MTTGIAEYGDGIDVCVLEDASSIYAIYDEWLQLACRQENATLLQFPGYYMSYVATLGTDIGSVQLVAIYRGSEIVALFPLHLTARRVMGLQLRILEFPGTPCPRRDAILSPDISCCEVLSILQENPGALKKIRWDVMRLEGVPEKSRLLTDNYSGWRFPNLRKHAGFNDYLDLTRGDCQNDHISSKFRNNLRRARKRLSELGECTFATAESAPALEQAFSEFIDVEASGWKSQRGGRRAIKLHAEQVAFYLNLLRRFSGEGGCHIHLLKLDDKPIAANFVIRAGDTLYSLKSGYDEEYRKMAPGQLLREYVINRYSADSSVKYFDMITDYDWLRQWRPLQRKVLDVYFFNLTLRGMFSYALLQIKMLVDKQRNRNVNEKSD